MVGLALLEAIRKTTEPRSYRRARRRHRVPGQVHCVFGHRALKLSGPFGTQRWNQPRFHFAPPGIPGKYDQPVSASARNREYVHVLVIGAKPLCRAAAFG